MYRISLNNSDLLLQKSVWWGYKWKPFRNLSEETRVLHELERDAHAKAKELSHLRMVAEANIKMDKTVLTHQLLTNSDAFFEFLAEPSILEEREGIKYVPAEVKGKPNGKQPNNKQGQASSNKDKAQGGKPVGDNKHQHNTSRGKPQTAQRSDVGGKSLLDLLVSTRVH